MDDVRHDDNNDQEPSIQSYSVTSNSEIDVRLPGDRLQVPPQTSGIDVRLNGDRLQLPLQPSVKRSVTLVSPEPLSSVDTEDTSTHPNRSDKHHRILSKLLRRRRRRLSSDQSDSSESTTKILPACRLAVLQLYTSKICHALLLIIITAAGSAVFHYTETANFKSGELRLSAKPFKDGVNGRVVDIFRGDHLEHLSNISEEIEKVFNSSDPAAIGEPLLNHTIQLLSDILSHVRKEKDHVLQDHYLHQINESPFTWLQSIMFSISTYTTIGYGNVTPASEQGRLYVILFSLISIPLWMVNLKHIGKSLTTVIKWLWSITFLFDRRLLGLSGPTNNIDSFPVVPRRRLKRIPLKVPVIVVIIYVILGVPLHLYTMGWTIIECVYYVVTSMCTIGFGDYIPSQQPLVWAISTLYVLIGLALVAMTINLGVENLLTTITTATIQVNESRRVSMMQAARVEASPAPTLLGKMSKFVENFGTTAVSRTNENNKSGDNSTASSIN